MSFHKNLAGCIGMLLCTAGAVHAQTQSQTSASPQPGRLDNTLNAPRLSAVEKLDYRLYRGFLVRGGIGSVLAATIEQASNRPHEWGGGTEAFAKRYASSLGAAASRQAVTSIVEVATGEDPRFFPSTEKGFKPRLKNVLRQVYLVKTDREQTTYAYGKIIGAIGSGQIQNAWLPASQNGVGHGFARTGLILAGDAGVNFLTEFVPFFRDRIFRGNNP